MTSVDTGGHEIEARTVLSSEIKRRRSSAGLSQSQLAGRIGYSRQYVSRAERPHNLPSQDLMHAIDTALYANGELLELWHVAKSEQLALRTPVERRAPSGSNRRHSDGGTGPSSDCRTVLQLPRGRNFSGLEVPAVVFPAIADRGRIVITSAYGTLTDPTITTSGRAVVLAHLDASGQVQQYAMDRRHARARIAASNPEAPLPIPVAYLLDDFTHAIIWAVTSLDAALLDDDADLADAVSRLNDGHAEPRSDLGPDLSPISRMWLGSDLCAAHILRNSDRLSTTPQFWSREQRGEEASTWLLFTHKYHYLRATTPAHGDPPIRAFCIPPSAVDASGRLERILLLLAMALHESMGITTVVCTEPEYTATPGFVLDRTRVALVANWVNSDQVWHVDVTDHRPTLREFDDAVGWASTRTSLPGETPRHRLHALADYLGLDWSWLTRRAHDLADSGVAGLCTPRSRLLSLMGLEQACAYLADLGGEDR